MQQLTNGCTSAFFFGGHGRTADHRFILCFVLSALCSSLPYVIYLYIFHFDIFFYFIIKLAHVQARRLFGDERRTVGATSSFSREIKIARKRLVRRRVNLYARHSDEYGFAEKNKIIIIHRYIYVYIYYVSLYSIYIYAFRRFNAAPAGRRSIFDIRLFDTRSRHVPCSQWNSHCNREFSCTPAG